MKHMLFINEVTYMKTYMTIAALVVLTLAFGIAYAEFPIAVKDDAGTILHLGAFPISDTAMPAKDFSFIGKHISEAGVETGTALYNDLLVKDGMVASSDARGSAAGGVATGDVNSRIWDDLLKPTGLSE
jgi:hypothetical protein